MSDHESVLRNMGTATWPPEDGTAYEVALEGINHVVGAYSRLIAEAESVNATDRAASLAAEQRRWTAQRRSLSPANRDQVNALTAECTRLLAELRGPA